MKNKKVFLLIALFCMAMISTKSFAQFEQKYTLQVSGGLIKPLGDMGDFFKMGFSIDAGAQYNYNRSLSFVGLVKYGKLVPKEDLGMDFKFNSLGITLCPKYRFMPESKFNPFVVGGFGLTFSNYTVAGEKYKFPTSLGFVLGAGVDYTLTDNLALFLQSGYSSYTLKDGEYKDKMKSIFFQVGLNISFLKSKSL